MKNKNLLVLVAVGTLLFGVTSATSDYMHYQTVNGIGTISICDPSSNGTKCITMQDRNLGATEAYARSECSECNECEEYYYCQEGRSLYVYQYWDSLEDCIDSIGEEECYVRYYDSAEECLLDAGDDSDYISWCLGRSGYGDTFTSEEDCNNRSGLLYNQCMTQYNQCVPQYNQCMTQYNQYLKKVYGYHFQWGNNYGFEIGCFSEGCSDEVVSNAVPGAISTEGYGPGNYFSSGVFRRKTQPPYDWSSPSNYNLRGGSGDSQSNNWGYDETGNVAINTEDRQGPCDTGYHVPSIGELNQVLKYWAEEYLDSFTYEFLVSRNSRNGNDFIEVCANYTCYHGEEYGEVACDSEEADVMICEDDETSLKFQEDFKIPFAGGRYSLNGAVNGVNTVAYFWSSSPKVVGSPSYDGAFAFLLGSDKVRNTYGSPVYGFSIRCFKDSYLSFPTNENGDSGSGSASTHVTLTLTAGSNTCTLNDYNLGTHNASADEQYIESSGQEILCEFLQNTGVRVLLSMGDLSDGSKLIGAENFTGVVTAIGNSLGSISNLTGGNYNLSGSQEIYRKAVNTLGKWTGDLQIIGTIPAGTPSGTYTGSLEIVIQEG